MKYRILLALFILWPSIFLATDTLDIDFDSLIKEVRYEYEIHPFHIPESMCMGTLSVEIDIPEETDDIVFSISLNSRVNSLIFASWSLDISEKSSVETIAERVVAHRYFSVTFHINGKSYRTSDFPIDDYIAPEDMEYLKTLEEMNANAIGEVSVNEPVIEVKDRTVFIKNDDTLNLRICTVDGKTVIHDRIHQNAQIPLDSGIYIISYWDNDNHANTKKIMIK